MDHTILLVGGGGREHALAWKIAQSPLCGRLIVAPGNPGIDAITQAECFPGVEADDVDGLVALAGDLKVDLVVVGPEAPLTLGLADALAAKGIAVFGPSQAAAQLEGSKSFTKIVCAEAGASTARSGAFTDLAAARAFLGEMRPPYVIKADGLAAGKGVVLTSDLAEAERELAAMLEGRFGEASRTVLIEEFLEGEEASVFALVDGETVLALGGAQDHKRAFDGDEGPNTGGMGAYSPAPVLQGGMLERAVDEIIRPVAKAMVARGTPYRGVLYAGLMIGPAGPRLIEFNARFGDPECQVLMLRLESDILPYLMAAATGRLAAMPPPDWDEGAAIVVVMAAKGYPGRYDKGSVIRGIEAAENEEGVTVFHAGTALDGERGLTASGGRVLNVCALGGDVAEARARAYAAIGHIRWPEGFYRSDIAWRALAGPR